MTLPSFQDFLAELTPDIVAGIMKDANNAAKLVEATPDLHQENIAALQFQSIAFQVSLETLAVYHKWLEQQL